MGLMLCGWEGKPRSWWKVLAAAAGEHVTNDTCGLSA